MKRLHHIDRYLHRLTWTALCALLIAGCTNDPGSEGEIPQNGPVNVRFSIVLPADANPSAATRMTAGEESVVSTVDVYHFVEVGGVYKSLREDPAQAGFTGGPPSYVNAALHTYPGKNSKLVFVANARKSGNYGYGVDVTLDHFLAALKFGQSAEWNSADGTSDPLPMFGTTSAVEIKKELDGTVLTGSDGKGFPLIRLHAKFNISVKGGVGFRLANVCLFNRKTEGYIAYDPLQWDDSTPSAPFATGPHVPASAGTVYEPTAVTGLFPAGADGKITNRLYCFEAKNEDITDRLALTAIVIGGVYDANANGDFTDDGGVSYYRVDIDVTDKNILRNHLYDVEVQSVEGRGYDTPKEAFEGGSKLTATVTDFNLADQTTVYGQYWLKVSEDDLHFDLDGGELTVKASTNYNTSNEGFPAGLQITVEYDDENNTGWLGLTDVTGADGSLLREFKVNTLPNSGRLRTAKIRITAGNFTKVIRVTQSGCFIRITDLSGNEITELLFTGTGTPAQQFRVTWGPANKPVTITRLQTGSEPFTWQDLSFSLPQLPAGGSYDYTNVDPTAIPLSTPFITRGSVFTFSLWDGGTELASNDIVLRQGDTFSDYVPALTVAGLADFPYNGGQQTFSVTSTATATAGGGGTVSGAVAWEAEFSVDGGATWTTTKPDWLLDFPSGGNGGTAVVQLAKTEAFTGIAKNPDEILQAANSIGTPAAPYDLSTKGGKASVNTANCYIVNAPGHYKLPLVYGNAIKNGATNAGAYSSTAASASTTFLRNFQRHDGNAITGPYIYNQFTTANATIVWMDAPGLITGIVLTDSNRSLSFEVPKGNIVQGNAIVAVRNSANVILWSWHIWITPLVDAENPAKDEIKNFQGKTYDFMQYNLGWCSDDAIYYGMAPRSVEVRLTQTGIDTPLAKTFTLRQNNHIAPATTGNSPYWQWGRKDPMPPATANNVDKVLYGNYTYTVISTQGTLGNAIQNPYAFYGSNDTWVSSGRYNNLWSANNTLMTIHDNAVVKTVYDPSPAGFKMPGSNAWTGFTTTGGNVDSQSQSNVSGSFTKGSNFYKYSQNQAGWTAAGTTFYPASGFRHESLGVLRTFGGYGYYHKATPMSYPTEPGSIFGFWGGSVYPHGWGPMSIGCSVRCVSE